MLRYGPARGAQRQQLKWIAYATALLASAMMASVVAVLVVGPERVPASLQALIILAVDAVPAAAGVAILRYRLFEIDRLINRTVVYGLLTALLGGVYAGPCSCSARCSAPWGAGSDLAVAASTLTVAALARPARRRMQRIVDHRFNRRRADAVVLLGAFIISARLRDEIDLDALAVDLPAVVDRALQPARISLWLRRT